MIKINNLHKAYGNHAVLKGLSLHVPAPTQNKGSIYGFLGKNGAGKTTTMNILTGLAHFQTGNCVVNGVQLQPDKCQHIAGIGYLPESPGMYSFMTGNEYLSFIGRMKALSAKELQSRLTEMLELTGMTKAANRRISNYSRGMRQRIGLAAALLHNPKLIFLDEPTSALDPEGRLAVLNLLEYLRDKGKTIFLSTHILSDVERICDTIGILHNGKLMIESDMPTLMKQQFHHAYDIQFTSEPNEEALQYLKSNKNIQKVEVQGTNITVWTHNDNAEKQLWHTIGLLPVGVHSFIRRKPSLEDIFLNVLKTPETDTEIYEQREGKKIV